MSEPHACPKCREKDRYLVTWADDRATVVRCRYCGHIFEVARVAFDEEDR